MKEAPHKDGAGKEYTKALNSPYSTPSRQYCKTCKVAFDSALLALEAGLCPIPPKSDGSKAPFPGQWKAYQKETPSPAELERWYSQGLTGVGLVTGAISRNLEVIDFDTRNIWEQYKAHAQQAGLKALILKVGNGYAEQSPNGFHLLYRCDEIAGNDKLACQPLPDNKVKTLIETRGEGGFIIVAPSTGVNSAGDYVLKAGGFDSIARITPEERQQLHALARTFDSRPRTEIKPPKATSDTGNRPGDDYTANTNWAEVLIPHGWTVVFVHNETTYWRRPGKNVGVSATTNHNDSDLLYVFSTSTVFDSERGYNRFSAYVLLNHDGDFQAAASVLAGKGYGDPSGYDPVTMDRISMSSDPTTWPEPDPLPRLRPPVPAFNPQMLPDAVRPWIEDISERIQCAPDYAAVGTMVALSSIIGRRVGICPKRHDDWLVVPNLWGGIVGRPGIMKTPALAEAMRPLRRLEREALTQYQEEHKEYEIECIARDARMQAMKKKLTAASKKEADTQRIVADIKDLKAQASEGSPICVRYETNDTTVEKLGELLVDNPNGLLMFRDELVGWLRNLDKQGHEGARSFFLEAWDGKSGFTYDRIGRGTIRIESACVAVLGGIQPGPLAQYVRDAEKSGNGADGLLQRFQLLVYPDEPTDWKNIDRHPNTEARNETFRHFWHLANLDPTSVHADMSGAVPFLRFSDAAQEIFTEWRTDLETVKLRADEPEIIESHLSKYRSLVPSLALICHLADGSTGPVSDTALLQAAAWAEYLEAHARRIYSIAMNDNAAVCALAHHIQSGRVVDGFKPRDVYRKHWRHLDKESTLRAIDALEMLDWLRVDVVSTGGRPTRYCRINPKFEISR